MQAAKEGGREALGFAGSVQREFAFLLAFGFRLVQAGLTYVRYESSSHFVNVFHGRSSYEIGVEVGVIPAAGEPVSRVVSLREAAPFIGLQELARPLEATAATSAESLARIVRLLATATQQAENLLVGTPAEFDPILAARAGATQSLVEGQRAGLLRSRADEAWRANKWDRVIVAYTEIQQVLTTQSLRPHEEGRLEVARKRFNGDGQRRG